ncbi:MAG: hypothetical protein ACNA71_07970, partial [Kiritimatiellia bacterium]
VQLGALVRLETAGAARARMLDFMSATAETSGDKVYVTHDGLLCGLLRALTNDALFSCTRPHYFEVTPGSDGTSLKIGRNNLGYGA